MITRLLLANVHGVPIWAVLEGSGDPKDPHIIKGIVIRNYSFGETNQEANILIKDQDFAGQLNQAILAGVAESEQILLADYENISWHRKFWYGCAFFIYSALIRFIAVEDFM